MREIFTSGSVGGAPGNRRICLESDYFYLERVPAWLVELLSFCQTQHQVASLPPWMDNEAFTEYSLETVEESANPCPGAGETGCLSSVGGQHGKCP